MVTTSLKRALTVALVAGAATAATAVPAQAAALNPCSNAVCLEPSFGGNPIVIQEGAGRVFPTPVTVRTVTNYTGLTYCFRSSPNFGLPPGGQTQATRRISAVFPLRPGSSCLS